MSITKSNFQLAAALIDGEANNPNNSDVHFTPTIAKQALNYTACSHASQQLTPSGVNFYAV